MDVTKEKAIQVAQKIKEIRLQRNKKQQEVADFLGMSKQSYFKYEKGIANVNMKLLIKLSKFYGLPEYYFLLDTKDKSDENFLLNQWIELFESLHKKISNQIIEEKNDFNTILDNNLLVDEMLSIQDKIINYFHNKSLELGLISRTQFKNKVKDMSKNEEKK